MHAPAKPIGRGWSNPLLAKVAARALIKNNLNATRAAKELRPHLTDQSARTTGRRIMNTPEVLNELEKQLGPQGLDDKSREKYVQTLWSWFLGPDKEKAQTAARILGRGFIGDKIQVDKPETLQISGFEEGVKRMLGPVEGADPEDRGPVH